MTSLAKQLGKRIKEVRESRKMLQATLAELIDMEPSNLSKLEGGNQMPKEENIAKIAQALNVEVRDLFDFRHFKKKDELKKLIAQTLDELEQNELEYVYKSLLNLKELKR
jgi:transcriptional regulator with XRE-family HTH domain